MVKKKQSTNVESAAEEFRVIGKNHGKVGAMERLTGVAKYTDDLSLPRMLHAKILRSPHAHARILNIDTSAAEALDGVFGVVVGSEMPTRYGVIPWTPDEQALAADKARYIGDAVAAIEGELAGKGLTPKQKLQKELHKRFLLMAAGNYKEAVQDVEQLEPEHQVFLKKQLYSLQVYANPETSPKDSHRAAAAVDFAREAVESLASVSKLELRNLSFCKQVHGFSRYDPVKVPVFTPTQDVVVYVEVDNFVSKEAEDGEFETGLKASYAIMHNGQKVSSMDLPVSPQRTRSRRRDYYVAYRVYMPDDAANGEYQFVLVMEDTKGNKAGTGKLDFKIQNSSKK